MSATIESVATDLRPRSTLPKSPGTHTPRSGVDKPLAPQSLAETGIQLEVLWNLALKLAATVPRLTTQWAATRLCLPQQLVAELLEHLRSDGLLDILGHLGHFNYQYAITERGGRRAARLMEISGYVGPAPVPLEAYTDSLSWQFEHFPPCSPEQVAEALQEMVLPPDVVNVAGLALLSRRSLFLHGPPGNGKTCLGHLLHSACQGELWIPHCLGIDENIIRVFDAQCHEPVAGDDAENSSQDIDRRWVRIRRPFVVVGGELTLDSLDLTYSQGLGYYEAPLHFKANGGTFLLDDFGCQVAEPAKFLNRWIHPLERGVDFLSLQTGQQLKVPFCQMLIVSTNINPNEIMSPAFLRRLGYRLHLDNPTPQRYAEIFERYAARYDLAAPAHLVEGVIKRYLAEGRPMRCCEPRDLIERARDISRYSGTDLALTPEILETAWRGYFGNHV